VTALRPTESAPEFDPLSDVFVAQFARPPDLTLVNLRTLNPYQRALLSIDGTVTKFLEAITMQPVDVVVLSQETRQLSESHDWLEVGANTPVIAREVLLRGRHDHTLHAFAASLLVIDRLPDSVKKALTTNPGGLGRILLDSKLETRREVLWYGRRRADDSHVTELAGRELLSRAYRIVSGGHPLMLINEQFPMSEDLLPSHE
jgi:chorismate-pyruvate lyase